MSAPSSSSSPVAVVSSISLLRLTPLAQQAASADVPAAAAAAPSPSPAVAHWNLTPNDYLLPHSLMHSNLWFFPRPESVDAAEFIAADRFEAALRTVLSLYPVIAGKVIYPDAAASAKGDIPRIEVDPANSATNQGGIGWTRASTDIAMSTLALSKDAYTTTRVLPFSLMLADDYSPNLPLLNVRHTTFACGSVCIGATMSHILGDAGAFYGMFADIAEAYATGTVLVKPHLDREWLIPTAEEVAVRGPAHKGLYYRHPTEAEKAETAASVARVVVAGPASPPPPQSPAITRVFYFSAAEVEGMKAAASKDLPAGEWVSTFEAFAAHAAHTILMARFETPELALADARAYENGGKKFTLAIAQNFRSKLKGQMRDGGSAPEKYFGNVALRTPVPFAPTELVQQSIGQLARQVHQSLAESDGRSNLDCLAWIASVRGQGLARSMGPHGLAITAGHKFGINNVSFHGVHPLKVCAPASESRGYPGLCTIMGSESELEILLTLEETHMARLEGGGEWRKFKPAQ